MSPIPNTEKAVVIIGSGAGGGTLAYELTKAGIPCVVLEAGPFIKNEDYHDNEWQAFGQMAWLDPRTTSGSWRVATDFPNLPAWVVKAVGGSTTHWSGATPRFKDYEFKARTTYGDVAGAALLDWPIGLEDLAPYYDKAEIGMGSSPPSRAASPAGQQQLQGVRQWRRARRLQALCHRTLRDQCRTL
jgi:choline dehydrogenase-like flavoprotein